MTQDRDLDQLAARADQIASHSAEPSPIERSHREHDCDCDCGGESDRTHRSQHQHHDAASRQATNAVRATEILPPSSVDPAPEARRYASPAATSEHRPTREHRSDDQRSVTAMTRQRRERENFERQVEEDRARAERADAAVAQNVERAIAIASCAERVGRVGQSVEMNCAGDTVSERTMSTERITCAKT